MKRYIAGAIADNDHYCGSASAHPVGSYDGAETELDYDAGGLLTHMVDASGAEHTYAYDADGRLLSP
jgi:YD repeat-containing protein